MAYGSRQETTLTVGASTDRQRLWFADTSRNQVFTNGDKVFVGLVAVRLESRLMPRRAKLSTATNVGFHVDTTSLEPG
jgi:hypothetical protein